MAGKRTFSEDVKDMWRQLSHRERVLYIVQTVLGIAILVMLLFGCMGLDNTLVNQIELVLVSALLVTSALRNYPQHKWKNALYILCAVAALFAFFVLL